MRVTLNIDDALLKKALLVTGVQEKTAVLHAGIAGAATALDIGRTSGMWGRSR